jgi:hypothetical protein
MAGLRECCRASSAPAACTRYGVAEGCLGKGDAAVGCARAQIEHGADLMPGVSVFAGLADVPAGGLSGGTPEAADRRDARYRLRVTGSHVGAGQVAEHRPSDGAPAGRDRAPQGASIGGVGSV